MIDVLDDKFKFLLEKEKYLGEYIALKNCFISEQWGSVAPPDIR